MSFQLFADCLAKEFVRADKIRKMISFATRPRNTQNTAYSRYNFYI